MRNYTPVEGKSGFFLDSESTAIINRDKKAYLAYMQRKKDAEDKNAYKAYLDRKKAMETKNNELDQMKEDLDNVKGELGEIKDLLSTLVQKLNN